MQGQYHQSPTWYQSVQCRPLPAQPMQPTLDEVYEDRIAGYEGALDEFPDWYDDEGYGQGGEEYEQWEEGWEYE